MILDDQDRGMRCGCGCGSRVTHTYRIDGGLIVVRRRQCLDQGCRLVWHSQEVRIGDWSGPGRIATDSKDNGA